MKKNHLYLFFLAALILLVVYPYLRKTEFGSCLAYFSAGFRHVAEHRTERFLGKVREDTIRCRGGYDTAAWRAGPWLDWQRYRATGDAASRYTGLLGSIGFLSPNRRGIRGALLDLEYQRIELLKFNLFDNSGTFEEYIRRGGSDGQIRRIWPQLRLPKDHPAFDDVGGDGPQKCAGELVRFRTVDGICNDIENPLMGATGQPFARNVDFFDTFPELGENEMVRNRQGDRIGLLQPDPQVISRKLFARAQSTPERCNAGRGLAGNSKEANCDYQKASHLNVLAAFWIQFMNHDWFSHLEEGVNGPEWIAMGCATKLANGSDKALSADEIAKLGCRPADRIDKAIFSKDAPPESFKQNDKKYLNRAYKTTPNEVTAWWDASQIYGFDLRSRRRVKRDPRDRAKLLLEAVPEHSREKQGYLPVLGPSDPGNPQWQGQEVVAFPDNWSVGLSFFHNVFAREHNLFVDKFREIAKRAPDKDSGLRNPARPQEPVLYKNVSAEELFEVARLVIAAEIAKIHTIEWTTQLLYNEPLYLAMNANWSGLQGNHTIARAALATVMRNVGRTKSGKKSIGWYSALATGPGIFGLGNDKPDVSGGVNHFGSPFNFPEEFINAYRLHPMVPDLFEYRDLNAGPDKIRLKIPVIEMLRADATVAMRQHGIANWALSLGRQRAGSLTLLNHPLFLQNLGMPRLKSATGKIDVAALDILRDRERGIPRYNEYRRQYGLKQLTSFDDFIDPRVPRGSPQRAREGEIVERLREVYGQHRCDSSRMITTAQRNADGSNINDCLGHADRSMVDNIEDLDAVVGWLAEFVRPHGFAIAETQLQVFILNASRRLFSDRFLTSSFRPEFYSSLGVKWVNDNGPDGKIMEQGKPNGHEMEVAPLKRVLLRTIPELRDELAPVVNTFDPWARDRGEYYSLQWSPRPGAESDDAFKK
jgi:Animal haem peroxidase